MMDDNWGGEVHPGVSVLDVRIGWMGVVF